MKLADVLAEAVKGNGKINGKSNGEAYFDADRGELIVDLRDESPAPKDRLEKIDSGYIDLGQRKKCQATFFCPVCGRKVGKGTQVAVIQAEGKGVRTYCHVECVGRWNGVADAGAVDATEIEAIAGRLDKIASEALSAQLQVHIAAEDGKILRQVEDLKATCDMLEELVGATQKTVLEVRIGDDVKVLDGEVFHPAFEEVMDFVAAGEEVFLPGPTGCGKSHMVEQIARAMGRRFGAISMSGGTTESHIFGRMVPYGEKGQFEFLGTDFLRCYEEGGIFLLDEMDAGDENVLISINSALANGFVNIPARHDNPVAKRHPDFVCIGAANTFGSGADRLYVGRTQLDEATLDRFRIGCCEMDYDRDLESKLCPETSLRQRLWSYRDKVRINKLQRSVSTRFLAKAYKLAMRCKASGKTYGYRNVDDYIDAKLFAGWSDREVKLTRGRSISKAGE